MNEVLSVINVKSEERVAIKLCKSVLTDMEALASHGTSTSDTLHTTEYLK